MRMIATTPFGDNVWWGRFVLSTYPTGRDAQSRAVLAETTDAYWSNADTVAALNRHRNSLRYPGRPLSAPRVRPGLPVNPG